MGAQKHDSGSVILSKDKHKAKVKTRASIPHSRLAETQRQSPDQKLTDTY